MADDPSVILFGTNYAPGSKVHQRFIDLCEESQNFAIFDKNIEIIKAEKNQEIVTHLAKYEDRIAVFHFEGRDQGYQELVDQFTSSQIDPLVDFLSELPNLHLVFLSGCATEKSVDALENSGIQAIVMTSRRLGSVLISKFCQIFYKHFFDGATIEDAVNLARNAISVVEGNDSRIFVGLRATEEGRKWRLEPHIVGQNDPRMIGWHPERNLPDIPFPGSRPYTDNEAGVFLGRRLESIEKGDQLSANREKPILLLHGQAGIGKSSFIEGGLLNYLAYSLTAKPQIIRLNGKKHLNLYEQLCGQLQVSSTIPHNRLWNSENNSEKTAILISIDQFETLLHDRDNNVRWDMLQVLGAIKSLIVEAPHITFKRVVLCCRTADYETTENLLSAFKLEQYRNTGQLRPLDREQICDIVNNFEMNLDLRNQYHITVERRLANEIANDLLADSGSSIAPFLQSILLTLWEHNRSLSEPAFTIAQYQQLRDEEVLHDILYKNQAQVLRQQWPRYSQAGIGTGLLMFHTFLFELSQSRTIAEIRDQYPQQARTINSFVAHLTDLYLLTDADNSQGFNSRLGQKSLLSPLAKVLYPESRHLERLRWNFFTLLHLPGALFDFVKGWIQKILGFIRSLHRALPSFFADTGQIIILLILLVWMIQYEKDHLPAVIRSFQKQYDLTDQVGALQSPALFQIQKVSQPDSIWRKNLEAYSGFQPLVASDIKFTQLHYLLSNRRLASASLKGTITDISFDSSSQSVYFVDSVAGLHQWDLLSAMYFQPSTLNQKLIALSDDGLEKVLEPADGTILIQNTIDNRALQIPNVGIKVRDAAFSRDGQLVAIFYDNGLLSAFNTDTGQHLVSLSLDPKAIRAIAIDSSKKQIAASSNHDVIIWNIEMQQQTHQLTGHISQITALNFSPDGLSIVSASIDATVRLWNLPMHTQHHFLRESTDALNDVNISNDGKLIVAGGDDDLLRIWDALTGTLLDSMPAQQKGITAVSLSSDSQWVATGGYDGSVQLWQLALLSQVRP